MIKRMVKFWSPYVLGVFIVLVVMGLTQDGKADWGGLMRTSIAGLIGTFIGTGLKKLLSEEKERNSPE